MNVQDFTYLLQHPDKVVSPLQTKQLEDVLKEYPYFQAAHALHLKGLKNLNSFKYNNALKVTAAYTTDRDVLFDFITSKEFLQNTIADKISGKAVALVDTEINIEEVAVPDKVDSTTVAPIPLSPADADKLLDPQLFRSKDPKIDEEIAEAKRKASENLELGEPLPFTKREKYSFAEWLQLTTVKSVKRDNEETPVKKAIELEPEPIEFPLEEEILKRKKFDLIDKFIEKNPKINPNKEPKVKTSITIRYS